MRPAELLDLIGEVREDYVLAAGRPAKRARPRWVAPAACAACAAAVLTAVFFLRQPTPAPPVPEPLPTFQQPVPAPTGGISRPDPPEGPTAPAPPSPALNISLDQVKVNELPEGQPSAALRADFHLTHQELTWGQSEIEAWFGKADFTPVFIPDGLLPAPRNNTAVVYAKDGEVVIDLLRLSFYTDYYEDGGPRSTDECVYARGFDLAVSRHSTHPFRDWAIWEPGVETSDIAGTAVTVTHTVYSYGPYDLDTHEPSGYYDWYSAEFALDGLNYEITAQRLTLEEVTAVAASVITGGTHFTVTGGDIPAADPPDPQPSPTPDDSVPESPAPESTVPPS